MSLPQVVSKDEWLAARRRLLTEEKELTRARDALNANRRRLPMVRVDKQYVLTGPEGTVRLLDLFAGRAQLVVYHFMFAPEWNAGCPSCSAFADQIGHLAHLHARGTSFACVSRAPFGTIAPFKARMGWTFPWYSSYGSDFNYDFRVSFDESIAPFEYNYQGTDVSVQDGPPSDLPGLSCFLREGDTVYHTYSTYARGLDGLGSTTSLLDLTALGRQEDWEEPKGRATGLGAPAGSAAVRHRDEYESGR